MIAMNATAKIASNAALHVGVLDADCDGRSNLKCFLAMVTGESLIVASVN